jgi:hypothetical protein
VSQEHSNSIMQLRSNALSIHGDVFVGANLFARALSYVRINSHLQKLMLHEDTRLYWLAGR